jgi:hypothetical protein
MRVSIITVEYCVLSSRHGDLSGFQTGRLIIKQWFGHILVELFVINKLQVVTFGVWLAMNKSCATKSSSSTTTLS